MRKLEPGQADYPAGLMDLRTPPVLWLRGDPPTGGNVAVVGTRHPDRAGLAAAGTVATALVERGYGIVSGLAPGVDSAAHRAALAAGGRTWAVLGAGADVVAPASSALAGAIAESPGSAVLSELEPGTPQSAAALVARDRLQSALSLAVIVVQTDLRSGTMHTARFTLIQHRLLAVVEPPPSTPMAPQWAGNAALLDRDGCDPALLHATGSAARLISARRPVADLAIGPAGPWDGLWGRLEELGGRGQVR